MRKQSAALLLAGFAALPALAQTAPAPAPAPEPTPEHTFATKISVYSEYEFRGLSQTSQKPALQLNLDYSHSSGFYAGFFATNIKWLKDTAEVNGFNTKANAELDFFGGYKFDVGGVLLDVGYLRYEYPSSDAFNPKPNTDEVYFGATWQFLSAKYSYSFNDTFGFANSEGSDFIELNIAYPLMDKVTLTGHVGHQKFENSSAFDYTVWKLGFVYDFGGGFTAGAYYKGTDGDAALYTVKGKDWSKERAVAFVSYTF